jgi:uncharacterized protein with NAD-binding domain and iron-sulfur cluster
MLKGDYVLLEDVKELFCWPNQPFWGQICDGDKIRDSGVNLEHYNSEPQPIAGELNLIAGQDFDRVVLGVTLDCLPVVASELVKKSARWQAMPANMGSTQTQAMQIWTDRSAHEMGIPGPAAVIGSYVEPWSSITDFSHLISREARPADMNVKFLTYSCGVLLKQPDQHQQQEKKKVKQRAIHFLENDVQPIWPDACSESNPKGIDWSVLIDAENRSGSDRFSAQYWRANIDPTELYVLSLPETMQYRLRAGDNDFDNLVICGTWTDAGFNIGSVECAMMSGLHASQFISGYPKDIIGSDW